MNSVKIIIDDIEKDMYKDFELSLKPRTRNLPPIKSLKTSIYGRSGDLDFTEALTGQPEYENREETLEFNLTDSMSNWDNKYSEVANFLHGRKAKLIFTSDSNYYFVGRLSMNDLTSDKILGTINIDCDLEPYKYKLNETNYFFNYKGVALLDSAGNKVKLRKINDTVKDSIVYYNDKWCIAQNVGEVIFDGSENWLTWYNLDNDNIGFYLYMDILGQNVETDYNYRILSNRFEEAKTRLSITNGVVTGIKACGLNVTGGYIGISVPKYILMNISTSTNAINSFKNWLSENNVTIQYALPSTTYIELSIDIQTMLSDLDTSYSIDGYSLQNGTPEPLKPIPIKSFGDLETIMLVNNQIIDKLTLVNDRKRVVPTIKSDSNVTLNFDNYSTTKSAGTYVLTDFVLNQGNNYISAIGDGSINFNYQEGSL